MYDFFFINKSTSVLWNNNNYYYHHRVYNRNIKKLCILARLFYVFLIILRNAGSFFKKIRQLDFVIEALFFPRGRGCIFIYLGKLHASEFKALSLLMAVLVLRLSI